MRIISKTFNERSFNEPGSVHLCPTEADDIYSCYNLISEGDVITASTSRKVEKGSSGAKSRVNLNVMMEVVKDGIEFDEKAPLLRLKGRNIKENENIKIGQYHTLEIAVDEDFYLEKSCWDKMSQELLQEVTVPSRKADVAVIVMQEGIANIVLVSSSMQQHVAVVEKSIPKKTIFNNKRDMALESFFHDVFKKMMQCIKFELVQVVIVASPGFLNRDYIDYIFKKAADQKESAALLKEKNKFISAYSSSGYVSSVKEIISNQIQRIQFKEDKGGGGGGSGRNQDLGTLINDTKYCESINALNNFTTMLSRNENKISYGKKRVFAAADLSAIELLLISDTFYRDKNPENRNRWTELMNRVKQNGGKIHKMSSQHPSGKQLNNYGGIAAVLRFEIFEEAVELGEKTGESQKRVPEHRIRAREKGGNSKVAEELRLSQMEESALIELCKGKNLNRLGLRGKNDYIKLLLSSIAFQAGDEVVSDFRESGTWLPATISHFFCTDKTYAIVYDDESSSPTTTKSGVTAAVKNDKDNHQQLMVPTEDVESSDDEFASDEEEERKEISSNGSGKRMAGGGGGNKNVLSQAALWDLECLFNF